MKKYIPWAQLKKKKKLLGHNVFVHNADINEELLWIMAVSLK